MIKTVFGFIERDLLTGGIDAYAEVLNVGKI
jgi:hypothetical protein